MQTIFLMQAFIVLPTTSAPRGPQVYGLISMHCSHRREFV